jgi:hypothetical protein
MILQWYAIASQSENMIDLIVIFVTMRFLTVLLWFGLLNGK